MPQVAVVGEAWGEAEERERAPFIGASGYLLTQLLTEAGLARADCFLTNVFNLRPQGNKVEALCGPKSEALKGYPALLKGKYVRGEFAPELERLGSELVHEDPNIIICLGNTAVWALLGKTAISKLRGVTYLSTHTATGFKILPTYHPAAVLRQWELRPTVVIDLMKARREAEFSEIRRPKREIWIEPTLEDLYEFDAQYMQGAKRLSVDIETVGSQITCIGFAPTSRLALVLPFTDPRRLGRSYWPTQGHERKAWDFVRYVCERPKPSKLFQNGLYDISFLWRAYGIRVMGVEDDTMLLHHALQPESLKALGFLGSIYTDEGPWKQEHRHSTTIKRDD